MRILLLFIAYSLIACPLFAQTKQIEGDTTNYFFHLKKTLSKRIGLQNLAKSPHEFSFRFWGNNVAIDIWKNKDTLGGCLTKYVLIEYQNVRKNKPKKDTLWTNVEIDSLTVSKLYQIVQQNNITEIPDGELITDWGHGFDGYTYIIEHANSINYAFKTYWLPCNMQAKEAKIICQVIKHIKDTIQLQKSPIIKIPKNACFSSDQGGMTACTIQYYTDISYDGMSHLAWGISAGRYINKIGNWKPNIGVYGRGRTDWQSNYDMQFTLTKWYKFTSKTKRETSLSYSYRIRKLNFVKDNIIFQNHNISHKIFELNKMNFGFSGGINYFHYTNIHKIGVCLAASQRITPIKLDIGFRTLIYSDQLDYYCYISKAISIGQQEWLQNISLGIQHEKFLNYYDFGFILSKSF